MPGLVVHESIAGLDWESLLGQRTPAITRRVKTIDTLREKLRREPQFPLVNIFDIAGRVEVQVRTEIQGHWANVYEVLADRVGRAIRYDQLPVRTEDRDLVLGVQKLSTESLRRMEAAKALLRELEATIRGLDD